MAHGCAGCHIIDIGHQLAAVQGLVVVGIRREHIAGLYGTGSIACFGADQI
ncbi:hypothetical protein D3C75_1255170 [compost metagenome]